MTTASMGPDERLSMKGPAISTRDAHGNAAGVFEALLEYCRRNEWAGYDPYDALNSDYAHKVINHAEQYVDGNVHTNRMENFWSLLKRSINGTYVSVEPFHLFRYLDEQTFRYNARNHTDAERYQQIGEGIAGKRLTYKTLIGGGF